MELNFTSNLFLEKEEMTYFKKSLSDLGYRRMFKQLIEDYGVVKLKSDTSFSALKITSGTSNGDLSLNAGIAIDDNINVVDIQSNVVDAISIPGDNVLRYITIKHIETSEEEGTVSISTSGAITGTGTKFTEMLRGAPNFNSVVKFTGLNTGEYSIQSVTDDLNAQLNVASGVMVTDSNQKYSVVGTFTPATSIPALSKYPFKNDHYQLTLHTTTSTIVANKEFILASATNNGTSTTIVDLRQSSNLFSIGAGSSGDMSTANAIVGHDSVMYDTDNSSKNENIVTTTWGFKATTGDWTYNSATQQVTITAGSGGSLSNTASFVTGSFDDWRLLEVSTGNQVKITSSSASAGNILLNLQFISSLSTASDLHIIPSADFIEFESTTATAKPKVNRRYIFPITDTSAQMNVIAGESYLFKWRHILGTQVTPWLDVVDGSAYRETNFDSDGNYTSGLPLSYSVLGGGLFTTLNPLSHQIDKASRGSDNTFSAINTFSGTISATGQILLGVGAITNNAVINDDTSFATANRIVFTTTSNGTSSGFSSGQDGKVITVSNSTSSTTPYRISHQSTLSLSQNRVNSPIGEDIVIPIGQSVTFIYNNSTSNWDTLSLSFNLSPQWKASTLTPILTGAGHSNYTLASPTQSVRWRVVGNKAEFYINAVWSTSTPSSQISQVSVPIDTILGAAYPILNDSVVTLHIGATYNSGTSQLRAASAVMSLGSPISVNATSLFGGNWTENSGNEFKVSGQFFIPLNI